MEVKHCNLSALNMSAENALYLNKYTRHIYVMLFV